MATVTWIKSTTDSWLPFDSVELDKVQTIGVYVIWHMGTPASVVRVGQGDIADRIKTHRNDPLVTQYRQQGALFVTWAAVPKQADRDGIERYLANHYAPLVGDAWPDAAPILVNLPGA